MPHTAKVYVAGHRGMVGSAILRELRSRGYENILTRSKQELDLCDQGQVDLFFSEHRPEQVYLAAAKVGGIHANNTYPASFIYENLMIEANIINSAWKYGAERLLFLGSSCIYPRLAPQPMHESALLTGPLEPTNEPYAIAKIAGIKLCESYNRQYGTDFRSVMPTNLYGPGDNYHSENSHVIPALIRRFHEAKLSNSDTVTIWGSGTPRREFLYVGDMAKASVHIMELSPERYKKATLPNLSHINVGSGFDLSILELSKLIARTVEYKGEILTDPTKPDGTPQKLMNVTRLTELKWTPQTSLEVGLQQAYIDFQHSMRL